MNRIKEEIQEFEENNDGYHVATSFDQGKPIEDSVMKMLQKALLGALFAIIIILTFLRDVRSTVIAVLSIPLSLLMAISILYWMDISLNIMTLGAMTVAVGRVVDDSIVVIENIYRRLKLPTEKLRGKELIVAATRQMFIPIFSSTIVTIAVFLPLGFVTGSGWRIVYVLCSNRRFCLTCVIASGCDIGSDVRTCIFSQTVGSAH